MCIILPFVVSIASVLSLTHGVPGTVSLQPPAAQPGTIIFQQQANITRATFNYPPINLLNDKLVSDLLNFLLWTQPAPGKTTPKVVVFDSVNPDYFLSHFDLYNIVAPFTAAKATTFNQLIACTRFLLNTTSTALIAAINGRVVGADQELSIQMDMRFAGPKAPASSFENSICLVPPLAGSLSWA